MDDILLSIVIPVFNSQNTIERLLDSIVANKVSFKYEIVLVNDASTDKTSSIIENYLLKASLIGEMYILKYIELEKNSGVSYSRNKGITESNGKYIMFIDSDDFVTENFLSAYVQFSESHHLDWVIGTYTIYDGINYKKNKISPDILTGYKPTKEFFYLLSNSSLLNAPVSKLYLLDLIRSNNLKFKEDLNLGEDLIFNVEYYFLIKKFQIIENYDYIYDQTHSGLTVNYRADYFRTRLKSFSELKNIYNNFKLNTEIFDWILIKIIYANCFQNILFKKGINVMNSELRNIFTFQEVKSLKQTSKKSLSFFQKVLYYPIRIESVFFMKLFAVILYFLKNILPQKYRKMSV